MEDTCVSCGRIVPEGTMVCKVCMAKADGKTVSEDLDHGNENSD